MRWARGRVGVDVLLADGRLEQVSGVAADGTGMLRSAAGLLESARRESGRNPEAAYVLAYDAARKASTALVAQQGLRTKSSGHHVTVEAVVRAQFGGPFDAFGLLRRRRAELEYPQRPGDDIEQPEAEDAITAAGRIVDAAQQLQPQLQLYR
jgi:hypothetical protein